MPSLYMYRCIMGALPTENYVRVSILSPKCKLYANNTFIWNKPPCTCLLALSKTGDKAQMTVFCIIMHNSL